MDNQRLQYTNKNCKEQLKQGRSCTGDKNGDKNYKECRAKPIAANIRNYKQKYTFSMTSPSPSPQKNVEEIISRVHAAYKHQKIKPNLSESNLSEL